MTHGTTDEIPAKLPAPQAHQLSLAASPAPSGSFDAAAADRGRLVFNNAGRCVSCHSGPNFTDAHTRLHPPSDAVSEPEPGGASSYAPRSAIQQYRTAPLKGLWQHAPYFHNGSAPTLDAVVRTCNTKQSLALTAAQIADLTEYLVAVVKHGAHKPQRCGSAAMRSAAVRQGLRSRADAPFGLRKIKPKAMARA